MCQHQYLSLSVVIWIIFAKYFYFIWHTGWKHTTENHTVFVKKIIWNYKINWMFKYNAVFYRMKTMIFFMKNVYLWLNSHCYHGNDWSRHVMRSWDYTHFVAKLHLLSFSNHPCNRINHNFIYFTILFFNVFLNKGWH